MAIFTADQLKKKYAGQLGGATTPAAQSPTETPSFAARVSTDITKRGNELADVLSQPASSPTEALALGTKATATAFGGITDVLAEAIKSVPGGAQALEAIGGVASAGFKSLTDELANTKFFQEAAAGLEPNNPLENVLSTAASGGQIADSILAAKGTAVGAAATARATGAATHAVATRAKSAASRVGSGTATVVKDIVPSRQGMINHQVSRALDLTPGDLNNIARSTGNEVAPWLSELNLIGKNKAHTQQLVDEFYQTNYKTVRDEIGKVTRTYAPYQIPRYTDALTQIQQKVRGVPGLEKIAAEVDNLLHKPDIRLAEVQHVKELMDNHFNLYKVTGDVGEGVAKEGLDNIRRDLKQFIEAEVKANTGADIAKLNNNVATARSISDAVTTRSSRGLTRSNLKLGDLGVFGIGSAYGTPLFGLALLFGKKLLESPTIRLRIARYLDKQSDARKVKLQEELAAGRVPQELEKLIQGGK